MPDNSLLTDQQQLLEKLQQLQQDYIATLPVDINNLQSLLDAFPDADHSNAIQRLNAMHQLLHRMAGSSGSFGLTALSEQARELDQRIQVWLADEAMPTRHDIGSMHTAVTALSNHLQASALQRFHIASRPANDRVASDSMTVWLSGDNTAANRDLLKQLSAFNYDCRLVMPADIHAAILESAPPRVVLLDFDSDADTVLMALNGIRTEPPRLIVLSRHDQFDVRVKAVRLHADGFFLKPISAPRIAERINQSLKGEQSIPERVLIIEDDTVLATRIRLIVEAEGMEAETLEHAADVLSVLGSFRPDLVLMDLYMPEFSGLDIAGVIRQHHHYMNLPIIYLSGETNPEKQMEAVRNGADDFLVKPVSDVQLMAAIRSRIHKYRLLESQIHRDSLTGLLRHSMAKTALYNQLLQAKRQQKPLSVAMIDIDHFKAINDTYGHAAGDSAIGSIATLLKQRLRVTDIIGRYGGEEFMVALPDCSQNDALRLMEDIRQKAAELQFPAHDQTFSCTISIGISCTETKPEADADQLIDAADQAMYQAKHNGRNQVVLCQPPDAGTL